MTTNATTQMILRKLGYTTKQHSQHLRLIAPSARNYQYALTSGSNTEAQRHLDEYTMWITKWGYDPLANTLI